MRPIPALFAAALLLAAPAFAQDSESAPPSGEGPYTQVFFQPGARILVSGFTDTVGSPDANRALSERRARAVAGALVDLGMDPDRLDVEGLGEDDVAVATADGVAEPLIRSAAASCATGGRSSQDGPPICAPQRGVPFCPGDRRCKRPRG